jgi:hypothetical protein
VLSSALPYRLPDSDDEKESTLRRCRNTELKSSVRLSNSSSSAASAHRHSIFVLPTASAMQKSAETVAGTMPLAPPIKRPASVHRHSIFTSCWRRGISNASDATAGRDYGGGEWKSCPPSLSRVHRSGSGRRSRQWGSWAEKNGLEAARGRLEE